MSEHVRWSRGAFAEAPARELVGLTSEQVERITALRIRYQVAFEATLGPATALNNYEYLDLLDRAWVGAGRARPAGGLLCDVGCASFWYAATLMSFFKPSELVGVDVEGYRLFKDGRTRIDYARGYLHRLPGRFVVADYRQVRLPSDIITAWFPFLTPAALLAWRLPLSLLAPEELFARVVANLRPGGRFLMVNHGEGEAEIARKLCVATGLRLEFVFGEPGVFSGRRLQPAVLSTWARS